MTTPDSYKELILPRSTQDLLSKVDVPKRHPGLQLDKLSLVGDMEKQKDQLAQAVRARGDTALFKNLWTRHNDMLDDLGARRLPMTTRGTLTLHLSRSGALENAGIALHPIYGFVYLPGSGIKGLVRAWAETVWMRAQSDKAKAWQQIEEAFGWSPGASRHKDWRPEEATIPKDASVGRLVFHDAWPTSWPRLIVDVVNNHHKNYYEGKDDPGDWEKPTLAYFLAVGMGENFEFAISDRKPEKGGGPLETACDWLKNALTLEGAGAKTAAGYGRFKPAEGDASVTVSPDFDKAGFASASFDLKLVTPAFLAGADQKKEDCDLRPATLRGLLRWWWRTMHADHLDREILKQLETAVWGDTQSGSPVRITVDLVEDRQPRQYTKQDQQFQNLSKPQRGQKVTQGLFYASYGMADDPKRENHRWYRPAGSCWRVTLTARASRFNSVPLTPQQLLEQATAALWLLTQFGGAGSRSRKGFGSFNDIEVQDIDSREDCMAVAAKFRELCKLDGQSVQSVKTPALEEALILEQSAAWNDPWYALDQTGMVLQLFTKRLDTDSRLALGLPRSVGRDKQSLRAEKVDRHASPALWSLATRRDGLLTVRLIAFPAARLPEKSESKAVLQKLIDFAIQELNQRANQSQSTGGRGGYRPPASHSRQKDLPRQPQSGPKAGDRVEAELLEEKTKKGGWKAKHLDGGLEGPIQDSQNAPDTAKPGQQVQLTIASVSAREMAFRWAAPQSPKKNPARQSRQRPGRGRR